LSTVEAESEARAAARPRERRSLASLCREPSTRTVVLSMLGLVAASTLLRAVLVTFVHSPTVFSDELGYTRLAQSIGLHGRLALFDNAGLSYSPLYPLIISPIYALGASAPTAYAAIKLVNALLISLALIPTYRIARFALPRSLSLLAAGVAAFVPLMVYPGFTLSENAAYPLCLLALWALLESLRLPSIGKDFLLVVSIVLATAARVQLIVLVPVALTAVVLDGLSRPKDSRGRVGTALGEHPVLLGTVALGVVAAGAAEAAGRHALSAFGRYANVGRHNLPPVGHFFYVLVQHIAGIDLAVGVVPFVAALVLVFSFMTATRAREYTPFAVVAVSLVVWLLLEVAYDAAAFDSPTGDIPRIHERFLIYVMPFFLVAPFAAYRMVDTKARSRAYLAAAVVATLLPLAIPFHTMVNPTIVVDTPALNLYARVSRGKLAAVPHAPLIAVWLAGTLSLLYVRLRKRLRAIVPLMLVPFVLITLMAQSRIDDAGNFARSLLPRQTNWVDSAHPAGSVILVSGRESSMTPALETAYSNLSVGRVYYVCKSTFGPEFGEKRVTIGRGGRLSGPSGLITARYVVAPSNLRPSGRVVARNPNADQVLVAPVEARVSVNRSSFNCK
jgi:hypothetical protein